METQQGEVCALFVFFVLLTSVELMSLFSPNERHILFKDRRHNTLTVYLTSQQMHICVENYFSAFYSSQQHKRFKTRGTQFQ